MATNAPAPPPPSGPPPSYDYDRPDASSSTLAVDTKQFDSKSDELLKPAYPPSPLDSPYSASAPLDPNAQQQQQQSDSAHRAAPPAQPYNQEFWQRAAEQERATKRKSMWIWRVLIAVSVPVLGLVSLKIMHVI